MTFFEVHGLAAGYERPFEVLAGVSFDVGRGQAVGIVGRNGVGKSTLAHVLRGTMAPWGGRLVLDGQDVSHFSSRQRVRAGIAVVPEGRGLFTTLSVIDNLEVAAYAASYRDWRSRLPDLFELFPRLKERIDQPAGTLSGGEQQMLAIGRALVTGPRLLVMDEPSLGLAPTVIRRLEVAVRSIVDGGIGILVLEQNYQVAVRSCQGTFLMSSGGSLRPLTEDERRDAYLVGRAMLGS